MKRRSIIIAGLLLTASIATYAKNAQEVAAEPGGTYEYSFKKYAYIDVQGGGQTSIGVYDLSKMISPTAQFTVGWQFSKIFGMRLGANGWQSKDGFSFPYEVPQGFDKVEFWKYNYIAPFIDLTVDLTNFGKFNPKKVCNIDLIFGAGASYAFNNDQANEFEAAYQSALGTSALRNIWDDHYLSLLARIGADFRFRLSDHLQLGLEVTANSAGGKYNSKKGASIRDWYMNALLGLRIALGKTYTETYIAPQIKEVEKIVEKIVEKEKIVEVEKEIVGPMYCQIYFKIGTEAMTLFEKQKIKEIANYLKKNPEANITITGYSDSASGTKERNMKVSELRCESVAKALMDLGIEESRITKIAKGDTEQIYDDPELNRIAVCVAK